MGKALDSDSARIERATAALDELRAKMSEPIKQGVGSLADSVREMTENLLKGESRMQRMYEYITGGTGRADPNAKSKIPELEWQPGKTLGQVGEWIDSKIGRTLSEVQERNRLPGDLKAAPGLGGQGIGAAGALSFGLGGAVGHGENSQTHAGHSEMRKTPHFR